MPVLHSVNIFFCISANGMRAFLNPLTFRSDSDSATFRFTSDNSYSEAGFLIRYELSECVYIKFVNTYSFLDITCDLYPNESEP